MKEVFMPSMDELYQMQELNVNLYKYILIKAIESLVCNGLNYPSEGIFKNAPRYLRENSEIARTICSMYPDEMIYSDYARNDVELAIRLMNNREKKVLINISVSWKFSGSIMSIPDMSIPLFTARLCILYVLPINKTLANPSFVIVLAACKVLVSSLSGKTIVFKFSLTLFFIFSIIFITYLHLLTILSKKTYFINFFY